ncbi:MAG TPA: energy transducer TonB [Vicinamibacterales bacterium]
MSRDFLTEVFTADELARAALVEPRLVHDLLAAGELRFIPGTHYVTAADAVRVGHDLRVRAAIAAAAARPNDLFDESARPTLGKRRPGLPAFASSFVHVAILVTLLFLTAGAPESVVVEEPREQPRLVFVMSPGPGGGGGGGGLRNPLPAPKVQRRGPERPRLSVPAVTPKPVVTTARREEPPKELTPVIPPVVPSPPVVEREPEPLPSRVLVAPVVSAAVDTRDREGTIENARSEAESQGRGAGGGAGTGQGTGSGEGLGSGIGDGAGGGTGGGPYRPGSGIEPPRLLKEVKADYTEEARRRGLQGNVVLEIVVRRDGSVGEVTLLQGLGSGLDQRAIAAVRQWRFDPARRRGTAVDVIVEVAVEFTLR